MKIRQVLTEATATDDLIGKHVKHGPTEPGLVRPRKLITGEDKTWDGHFICDSFKLKSLRGCPSVINGAFSASSNALTNLEHAPSKIKTNFFCDENQITSLKGAPEVCPLNCICSFNKITSLDGAPSFIGHNFFIPYNKLTSLHNIHKQITHIGGTIWYGNNPITKQILGLLLIKNLNSIDTTSLANKLLAASKIVNKYLPNDSGMTAVNECQDELIEAGLEDFAEL